jgi:hypothetical protein
VAEGGAGAASEDGRRSALQRGLGWPANRIDGSVLAEEAAGADAVENRAVVPSGIAQLNDGGVPVLTRRNGGNAQVFGYFSDYVRERSVEPADAPPYAVLLRSAPWRL